MCPQAITFAGKYLLITAYDTYSEEKSVIYVMNKYNRKLLTVIVLPNKTHGGGICYDGKTVWVTNGQKISGVAFTDINCAASKNLPTKKLNILKHLQQTISVHSLHIIRSRFGQVTLNIQKWNTQKLHYSQSKFRKYNIKRTLKRNHPSCSSGYHFCNRRKAYRFKSIRIYK